MGLAIVAIPGWTFFKAFEASTFCAGLRPDPEEAPLSGGGECVCGTLPVIP